MASVAEIDPINIRQRSRSAIGGIRERRARSTLALINGPVRDRSLFRQMNAVLRSVQLPLYISH